MRNSAPPQDQHRAYCRVGRNSKPSTRRSRSPQPSQAQTPAARATSWQSRTATSKPPRSCPSGGQSSSTRSRPSTNGRAAPSRKSSALLTRRQSRRTPATPSPQGGARAPTRTLRPDRYSTSSGIVRATPRGSSMLGSVSRTGRARCAGYRAPVSAARSAWDPRKGSTRSGARTRGALLPRCAGRPGCTTSRTTACTSSPSRRICVMCWPRPPSARPCTAPTPTPLSSRCLPLHPSP